MKRILIINGPNLNLLGKREPVLYGSVSFEEFLQVLRTECHGVEIDYIQKNGEEALIDAIQKGSDYDAVVLNPAAFSHTSMAVADAVAAIETPVIEVHISNIFARDANRHHSLVSKYAAAIVVGAGLDGYRMAIGQALRF
ncbi:MAG TPA: type II 3-dehydroquinate dehydratase [Cryomorphaceae bacterium]|nr:type II 3-dehydroquinate dehydratase [Cryomorphaceae bacterium]